MAGLLFAVFKETLVFKEQEQGLAFWHKMGYNMVTKGFKMDTRSDACEKPNFHVSIGT